MKLFAPVLAALLFIGCGDDDSPTASNPDDELVGTWVGVSSTESESEADEEAFRTATLVVRRDGTMGRSVYGVPYFRGDSHCDRGGVGNC